MWNDCSVRINAARHDVNKFSRNNSFLFRTKKQNNRKDAKGAKTRRRKDQTVSRAPFEILEAAAPLKHAFVVEAKKAVVPNHDVIEDAHAHHVPDFF